MWYDKNDNKWDEGVVIPNNNYHYKEKSLANKLYLLELKQKLEQYFKNLLERK